MVSTVEARLIVRFGLNDHICCAVPAEHAVKVTTVPAEGAEDPASRHRSGLEL